MLQTVPLPGTVMTLDAIGCQREVAETLSEQGGDYLLTLNGNQPQVHADVRDFFVDGFQTGFANRSREPKGGKKGMPAIVPAR